jgi:hypothetical protein
LPPRSESTRTQYQFACQHWLPLLSIAGRYYVEGNDMPAWYAARNRG